MRDLFDGALGEVAEHISRTAPIMIARLNELSPARMQGSVTRLGELGNSSILTPADERAFDLLIVPSGQLKPREIKSGINETHRLFTNMKRLGANASWVCRRVVPDDISGSAIRLGDRRFAIAVYGFGEVFDTVFAVSLARRAKLLTESTATLYLNDMAESGKKGVTELTLDPLQLYHDFVKRCEPD